MNRRLLLIDPSNRNWQLETLQVEVLDKDPRADYLLLGGETLCQHILRREEDALVLARGPMPFLSGNKTSVGYVSPPDFPHRVYEALSLALELTPGELESLMQILIEEWKRQAGEVMGRFGHAVTW